MKDRQIQEAVLRELDWEPQVRSTDIGVTVRDGVVSLSGFVPSWSEKHHAEQAVKRVIGVRAVADDLQVSLPGDLERSDPEIARAAAEALDDETTVSPEQIRITVHHGRITLEGSVAWQYQKDAAEAAVRDLIGAVGVTNLITVTPLISAGVVQREIESALERAAQLDARRISVETTDGRVILRGSVRAWAEREEAELAAWRAPGITVVENHIAVVP